MTNEQAEKIISLLGAILERMPGEQVTTVFNLTGSHVVHSVRDLMEITTKEPQ
jgi:hypothetical protein